MQLVDGRIRFNITAYSRPASRVAKFSGSGPITRAAHSFMTQQRALVALGHSYNVRICRVEATGAAVGSGRRGPSREPLTASHERRHALGVGSKLQTQAT